MSGRRARALRREVYGDLAYPGDPRLRLRYRAAKRRWTRWASG